MLILSTTFISGYSLNRDRKQVNCDNKCSKGEHDPSSVPPEPHGSSDSSTFTNSDGKKKQKFRNQSLKSIFNLASRKSSHETVRKDSKRSKISSKLNKQININKPLDDAVDDGLIPFNPTKILPFVTSNKMLSEIHHQVAKVVDQLHDSMTIKQMSEVICAFYQSFDDNYILSSIIDSTDSMTQLVDYIETRLLGPMFNSIRSEISSEFEKQDLKLFNHISNLNWINVNHLELKLDLENPEIRDLLELAISLLIKMGSKESPAEKLNYIVNCSKTIITMLEINFNHHISADQLLPALVWIIIKANPPMLKSDITFIDLFSYSKHLMSGETGYYFTNLCCAIIFIENLDHNSLTQT